MKKNLSEYLKAIKYNHEPTMGIGPMTSFLPRMCSTTEPCRHKVHTGRKPNI